MCLLSLDINELAKWIEDKYLPFAWSCSCGGTHPECAETKSGDVYAIAQADTVLRITQLIRGLK